ncbi:hypothetical protein CBR_g50972 [Chara braunii]|uniref:Uncharacterized protein n=1 Tax=Chara braunii TaxID=69332 RepID=A0A388M7R4_CHABU|nr:hypothetical protein CBR_g50972 [Chara braunii]|eukprot:GBG90628.1 hypothetical protein CBR_g50972 [Chara braunii]
MRMTGVEATLEASRSRIRAGETDTRTRDMRDRTEIDIGTTNMRGRIEMDTEVAGMREQIETETDEMTRADGMTAGDSLGRSVTICGGGMTEEIAAMSRADDKTMETTGMTHGDDISKEDLEETAAMIRAAGTREGDMAPTKSARGSTSKKTDTDYVMAEKDGQRIDGEEVILSPRKRGVKKFLMKSSLDEIDTVTPKADAPTVAVSEVTGRADRMTTVFFDGMEGVPPDKFYILGSGTVKAILNDGAVLDAVIDNSSEVVIKDEDLAEQVGLGLDRSYLFEIETADGRKQQITGICHKAAIEVQGVRVTLPVFAVKNCSAGLLLGRTWLSHVHVVTIERPDGSQTLSIKKLDGTRVMIETVESRDPRNRTALVVGAGPSDQIKSLPISGRAVRFREKNYGPLLTEEEGWIVEVEDLGSRLIVDGNSYPKEADE